MLKGKKKKEKKRTTTTGTPVCPHSEGSEAATANSPSLQLMGDGSARYFAVLVVCESVRERKEGGERGFSVRERERKGESERAKRCVSVSSSFVCRKQKARERRTRSFSLVLGRFLTLPLWRSPVSACDGVRCVEEWASAVCPACVKGITGDL